LRLPALRLPLLALACALLAGLPFLGKAYTVDDPTFIRVTENILENPLRPLAGTWNWFGETTGLFFVDTNPPLPSYVLSPFAAAFGFSGVSLHAGMLLFLVLLAFSMASLSRRFAGGSAWPVLFVMLSPAVVVSGNLMRDVPMTAFFAASVALFVAGTDRDRPGLLAAGASLAGCAFLSKYSGALAFGVLAAYPLLRGRFKPLLWLPLGLVLPGLWFAQNLHVHGITHLGHLLSTTRPHLPWPDPAINALTALGASCLVLPALLAALARGGHRTRLAVALATGLLAALLARLWHGESVGGQYLFWTFAGGALLGGLGAGWMKAGHGNEPVGGGQESDLQTNPGRDDAFLTLWVLAVVGFSVFGAPFQAVRHLIPALAPLCLLGVRQIHRAGAGRAVRALLVLGLSAQAVLAFWAGYADARSAGVYRTYAQEAAEKYAGHPGRVWFGGHWGWQRYALEAGWEPLAVNGPQPEKGDLVILPERIHRGRIAPGLMDRLGLAEKRSFPAAPGLFTMNPEAGASFYLLTGPRTPFAFSWEPGVAEVFRVYEVVS